MAPAQPLVKIQLYMQVGIMLNMKQIYFKGATTAKQGAAANVTAAVRKTSVGNSQMRYNSFLTS